MLQWTFRRTRNDRCDGENCKRKRPNSEFLRTQSNFHKRDLHLEFILTRLRKSLRRKHCMGETQRKYRLDFAQERHNVFAFFAPTLRENSFRIRYFLTGEDKCDLIFETQETSSQSHSSVIVKLNCSKNLTRWFRCLNLSEEKRLFE